MIFIISVLIMVAIITILGLICSAVEFFGSKEKKEYDVIEGIFESLSTCSNNTENNLLCVICEQSRKVLEEKKEKLRIDLLTNIVDEIRYDPIDMFTNHSTSDRYVGKYNYLSFLNYIKTAIPDFSSYSYFSESVKKLINYSIDFLKIPDNKGRFEDLVSRIESLTMYYSSLDNDVNLENTVALVRKITRLTIKNSKKEINIVDYAIIKSSTRNREWKKIKDYVIPYFILRGKLIYDTRNTVYNN